jgi:hypothetical protein
MVGPWKELYAKDPDHVPNPEDYPGAGAFYHPDSDTVYIPSDRFMQFGIVFPPAGYDMPMHPKSEMKLFHIITHELYHSRKTDARGVGMWPDAAPQIEEACTDMLAARATIDEYGMYPKETVQRGYGGDSSALVRASGLYNAGDIDKIWLDIEHLHSKGSSITWAMSFVKSHLPGLDTEQLATIRQQLKNTRAGTVAFGPQKALGLAAKMYFDNKFDEHNPDRSKYSEEYQAAFSEYTSHDVFWLLDEYLKEKGE